MIRWTGLGKGLGLSMLAIAMISSTSFAQAKKSVKKKSSGKKYSAKKRSGIRPVSGPEISLIRISLYDTSLKVIGIYGSPDEIQAVNIGGGTTGGGGAPGFGGGGGARGGGGFPGGGARGGGGGGKGGGSAPGGAEADVNNPFEFGDDTLRQLPPGAGPQGRGGGGFPGGPGSQGFPGGPGGGSFPGAPGGAPGRGGGSGLPGGGGGAAERVQYTRWVYNRDDSKYGFIIDKTGHVVQIEAIGLSNPKVKTKRGIVFGSNFASLVKAYSNPDGYEIAGDNLLVKYLVRSKVAFRMSRLAPKKPHVVTGIVIAAGKS